MSISILTKAFLGMMVALFMAEGAQAGLVNDVPSCYSVTNIAPEKPPYDGLIYVLIDETVALDASLKQSVLDNVMRLMNPGTKFVIAEFSAFSQGHYLAVLHTGIVEKPINSSRVADTPIQAAQHLTGCLGLQKNFADKMVVSDLKSALDSGASSFDQSDIMQALKIISRPIAEDKTPAKTVFLITDGLENSSVTSFYSKGSVKLVNAKEELEKAKASDMMGNFGGARVYVIGGAMMPPVTHGTKAERDGYRNPQVLHALSAFWAGYFKSSNANLVEFGEPALVSPVSLQ